MSGLKDHICSVGVIGYDLDYDHDLCLCGEIDSTKCKDMWLETCTCKASFPATYVAKTF